jgi:hypothetical protein
MQRIITITILGIIGFGLVFRDREPAISLKGEVPIPRAGIDPHLWNDGGHAEDRISIRDRAHGTVLGSYDLDERGVLNQTTEQAKNGPLVVDYRHQAYGARTWVDVGAWAGVVGTNSGDPPVQLGLRVSCARFVDGIIAPDVVVSEHAVGVGVSCYLPRSLRTEPPWNKLGVGLWYVAAYNGDGSGPALGLTLTTR